MASWRIVYSRTLCHAAGSRISVSLLTGRNREMTARAYVLIAVMCTATRFTVAQQPQPPAIATSPTTTRPCSANPVLAYVPSKKSAKRLKNPPPSEPAPVCIEVKGEPLGIQEFLQNVAREQSWRIGENHTSEDMWSFVRYFNPYELETYADTKVTTEPVTFTSGKGATTVRTADLGDEFVRVQVSVHFQGEGKSADPNLKQPATVWPLKSKGVFEQQLVAALQTRYRPME